MSTGTNTTAPAAKFGDDLTTTVDCDAAISTLKATIAERDQKFKDDSRAVEGEYRKELDEMESQLRQLNRRREALAAAG